MPKGSSGQIKRPSAGKEVFGASNRRASPSTRIDVKTGKVSGKLPKRGTK